MEIYKELFLIVGGPLQVRMMHCLVSSMIHIMPTYHSATAKLTVSLLAVSVQSTNDTDYKARA